MKKLLLTFLILTANLHAHAFTLNISRLGLSDADLFSVYMKSVSDDCAIAKQDRCTATTSKTEDLPLLYMSQYFALINSKSKKQTLKELNIKINGVAFKNCQHIETQGQHVSLTLTSQGCV